MPSLQMNDIPLFNTETILQLLDLDTLGADRFLGQSHNMGSPRIFGGQVVGQSLVAAARTVEARQPYSLHAVFLEPGDLALPVDYDVERVRDGGSFSTRRVVASQQGRCIFMVTASFQVDEQGYEHQRDPGTLLDPETMESIPQRWRTAGGSRPYQPLPVDFRAEHGGDVYNTANRSTAKQVWVKAPRKLADDPAVHQSLFAYVSDYGMLSTALQPHGVGLGTPGLQMASLDHTIWFHRPLRMDRWLRFDFDSPNASGGRGLTLGHVYQDGVLVATLAQEGLMRMRSR